MNYQRRKNIRSAIDDYLAVVREARENLACALSTCRDEEEEAFDALPESLYYAERGEEMQECISVLEDAIDGMEDDAEEVFFDHLYAICKIEA